MRANRAQFHQIVKALAAETETYIKGLGVPHPFIARLFNTLGWSQSDLLNLVLKKHLQFIASTSSLSPVSSCQPESKIQKFCHKIWLTSLEEPHLPPEDLLSSYFAMCKSHPADWTHLFWTNNDHVLRHVSARALDKGAKTLVLNIDGILLGSIESTVRKLIAHRKFVLAADVLKFVILDRHGGIYSDLGVFFDESILQIAAAADYTFLLASNVFFQTSWVSLAKGSFLSSVFLGIMNNPEILSIDYALDESKTINAGTEVHTFAGLGYTTCAILFMPRGATCFAFPENLHQLEWRGQQSWYGDAPKFGNALINASMPSIFSQERYATFASAARERLRTINANGRLTEMAKIIVNLFEFFQQNPTRLCRCLAYNGSDRVGGWHNYGYVYFFLVETFSQRGCTILEVGDASSLWGKSGPGGVSYISQGGSIRAWKEYLGALTFGAEIDRSLMSAFSLDDAVLVNEKEHIALREQVAQNQYDIIIDNGVHHFEASVTLLEAAFGHLAAPGIYVIEAVPLGDIVRWEVYLTASDNAALIILLPSAANDRDNCLVIILKTRA